jgi:chorismate mutase/prephenate dehydratase
MSARGGDSNRPVTVVFQGAEGAFSHIAGRRFFAPRQGPVTYRGLPTFRGILEEVRAGAADYAMLPIENTTSGSVHDAYDALSHTDLAIVGEEVLRIELCLVGIADIPLEQLRKIYSHPQALSQCTAFLASMPQCTIESFTDTAMSVERVKAEHDPTHASIASAEAASLHGLHVLRRDIANHRENYTRFLVIAREVEPWDARVSCKTSVMFVTPHERGALLACLNVLAGHGLNLTKLESRPRPGRPFEYLFYVDFEGNVTDPGVQRALDEISGLTLSLKIFGSYPARTKGEEKGLSG